MSVMRFALFTNVISPHQLPLAREIIKIVGEDNFRYLYTDKSDEDHKSLGWGGNVLRWCVHASDSVSTEWLENVDVLLSGLRAFDLFERREAKGLKNLYMTERWLKPPIGILRLIHPRYLGYVRRLFRMMTNGKLVGLPIGIYSALDMVRLCGLMHGDLRCLFRAPKLEFEKNPGGKIWMKGEPRNTQITQKYCLEKMRMWGYFVESGKLGRKNRERKTNVLRVLWVGRLLRLKRVDTIIRAVGELSRFYNSLSVTNDYRLSITLDIYGTGSDENRLRKMAERYGDVMRFYPPVPIDEVRKLMREHDVYILASNGYEGWGAVVSEALEEGLRVIGTHEAGACATMLQESDLFHSGDWRKLYQLLKRCISEQVGGNQAPKIGDWNAHYAAKALLKLCDFIR